MSAFGVIWSGLENLINSFKSIQQQTPANITQIYADVGGEAKDLMDSLTPVKTGRLKAGNKLTLGEMSAILSNDVDYAIWVNGGTRHQPPQPFFDPAVEYMDQQLKERLPKAIGGNP